MLHLTRLSNRRGGGGVCRGMKVNSLNSHWFFTQLYETTNHQQTFCANVKCDHSQRYQHLYLWSHLSQANWKPLRAWLFGICLWRKTFMIYSVTSNSFSATLIQDLKLVWYILIHWSMWHHIFSNCIRTSSTTTNGLTLKQYSRTCMVRICMHKCWKTVYAKKHIHMQCACTSASTFLLKSIWKYCVPVH